MRFASLVIVFAIVASLVTYHVAPARVAQAQSLLGHAGIGVAGGIAVTALAGGPMVAGAVIGGGAAIALEALSKTPLEEATREGFTHLSAYARRS